jgi:predicted dehydrogenase
MTLTRIAVIGVGHLGKEHARILSGMPEVKLVGVVDVNREQAEAVAGRCGTQAFPDFVPLLDQIDAATVVVPTVYHHRVASALLERGIHLLVEKPLAHGLAEASDLELLARRRSAILQVGHIERFNPAWEELLRRPLRPKFITCERLAPFSGRSTDTGVVLDLMIHDLDLVLSHVGSRPTDVVALGASVFGRHEDMAQAILRFDNGCIAQIRASRVHPTTSRQMQLFGAEGFASIDFARRRLTLVQPSATLGQLRQAKRPLDAAALNTLKTDLYARHLQTLEIDCTRPADQLTMELQAFVTSVRTGKHPRVDGRAGCEAIALATRILDSVRSHRWEGNLPGPMGPFDLPASQGPLFEFPPDQAAA